MIGHLLSRISVAHSLIGVSPVPSCTFGPLSRLRSLTCRWVMRSWCFAQERHRVVVAGRVVPDVEVDDERLRHAEQLLHALGRRHFVRIVAPARADARPP